MIARALIGAVGKITLVVFLAAGAWTAWELRPPPDFPSDAKQIDPRPVEMVAIDPSGRNVAYVTRRSPSNREFDLNILNFATGQMRTLPNVFARQWSPEGSRLLCGRWRAPAIPDDTPGYTYFWLKADGSEIPVAPDLVWGWAQVSPEGDVVGVARQTKPVGSRRFQRYRVPARRPREAQQEQDLLNLGGGTYRARYAPNGEGISISYATDPEFFDVDLQKRGVSRRILSNVMLGDARLSPDGEWLLTLQYQPRAVATWLRERAFRLWKMARREGPHAPFQIENALCAKLVAYHLKDSRKVEIASLGGAGTLIAYYEDVETYYPEYLACGLTQDNSVAIFLWGEKLYRMPVKDSLR